MLKFALLLNVRSIFATLMQKPIQQLIMKAHITVIATLLISKVPTETF